ncbi:MAG: fluoride efflux transporter CrcB [Candidatus Eisenbacteria bacterium]|nr:fluoride efflux transporter CrcB [Candidatus Eisenbacteria bacterium]
MGRLLLVGLGGALGSMARYLVGGLVGRMRGGASFPFETLLVNVTGCLVIGLLAGLAESRGLFSGATRAFLFIGVLGGFTTFSTFGYETFQLARGGEGVAALASVALHLVLGLGAVWAGFALARAA